MDWYSNPKHAMKHQGTRRNFLKQTGMLAAGTALANNVIPHVHAAENDTIKVALVGCGGRGTGAARQTLAADPNVKFWAVADVFSDKSRKAAELLQNEANKPEITSTVDLSRDRIFDGFDAYKKAMDMLSHGDVVLLATPPAFRPLHFAYAIEKGLHVFAEKALAVDIPSLKEFQEPNKMAKAKNLKIAVGLNNRHYFRTEEAVKEIHGGKLGELFTCFVYRSQPRGAGRDPDDSGLTTLQSQLRRTFRFTWLTGSSIVDGLIHNLDICCWAKQQTPVAALGMGGRLLRRNKDESIDNAHVQFTFPDGKKMMMYTLGMENTWAGFRAVIHGSKGSAVLGESVPDPKFYEDWNDEPGTVGKPFWMPKSAKNTSHQTELDRFFKAIREDRTWNEMEHGISATFTAIMGRMAIETGKRITAEEAWASTFQYTPNIAEMNWESAAPVMPDANGNYRAPRPGTATVDDPYKS